MSEESTMVPETLKSLMIDSQLQIPDRIDYWRIVPASVSGTSHQKRGLPCQDAYHWNRLPKGILVAAVADGAGSASLAEVGAEVAAQTAVERLGTQAAILQLQKDDAGWLELLSSTLKTTQTAIAAEAVAREVEVRELATTLILVVATPALVAVAQVGDGAAVVEDNQGNLIALTSPDNGEYANQTTFLISREAADTAQMNVWRGELSHLAIFSDGLQRLALKLPEGTPHKPFFSPLFQFAMAATDEESAKEQLMDFLRHGRIAERTDDDLTILLATLNPPTTDNS